MKLLLVMLLVSGLLIGESRAQRPIVRFFSNLYVNLRNGIRNVVGITSTSITISSTTIQSTVTATSSTTIQPSVTTAITSLPDILRDESKQEIVIDFPILINSQFETMDTVLFSDSSQLETMDTEPASFDSATTESGPEPITEISLETTTEEIIKVNIPIVVDIVEDLPDIATTDTELELSTINPQMDLTTPFPEDGTTAVQEMNTGMPQLDPMDISAMEAMVQTLLQIPTTTMASPTTPDDIPDTTETEPTIEIEGVQPIQIVPTEMPSTMTSSSVQFIRTSATFSSLAPKRTIHFTRPSWTPSFLKLASRNAGSSRYFFPAHFRRSKGEYIGVDVQEDDNILLKPSKVLP